MLAPLNSTMIAVGLAQIGSDFGAGLRETGWLVTAYLIAMAVSQPIAGSLGDIFSRRRIFLGALVGLAMASIGAGLARGLPLLVAFRIGQALAGAMAIPNGMALIRQWIPSERRGAAFGLLGAAVALAAGVGPLLGGYLVGLAGWRAIFWVNIPLIGVALALAWFGLPRGRGSAFDQDRLAPASDGFDFSGAALLATGLTSLALIPSTLQTGKVVFAIGLGAAAIAFGVFFVRNEQRVRQPIVNLALLRVQSLRAASVTVALGNLAIYSALLLIPQFLTSIQHRSSVEIGTVMAALSIPLVAFSPVGGWLADRWGRRRLAIVGGTLMVLGMAPFLALQAAWSIGLMSTLLALVGCGLALQAPAVQAAALEAMPGSKAGQASGVFSASRYLGGIAGSAMVVNVLGNGQAATALSDGRLFVIFVMIEAAIVAALIASLRCACSQSRPGKADGARAADEVG